jgi:hypothetical protein
MAEIVVLMTNNSVPVTGGTVPTIRVRRLDTNALVETDSALTEVGDGIYSFSLTTASTLEYSFRVDLDPGGAGQTTASERFQFGSVSGIQDAILETDVPAVLVDTGTTIPGLLATIDTVVDDILADTGTTIPALLSTIDSNVDAILVDTATTIPGLLSTIDTVVDAILVDTGTSIPALFSSIPADVWGFDVRGVTGVTFDTAAKALNSCRMIHYNTLEPTTSGSAASMTLREDDGTTAKAAFAILDVSGSAVTATSGAAANRAAGA